MVNATAVTTVQNIIEHASSMLASDIHLEQVPKGIRVRFRCDGFLHDVMSIPEEHALRVLSRIKLLAQLDIAERRIPQDGAFVAYIADRNFDIRVATFPTRHGEKIVLRLLDHVQGMISCNSLGFSPEILKNLDNLINRSQGLIIVTGPTGSGKTTTLYSLLSTLSPSKKNIITLEDPVEYTIPGATQTQIRSDLGFGFSEGIRAVLRQDPDIIMIGEIRDVETARAALRAALTGHLVFTTLHTTDALSVLTRLLDMGIESYLLNAVLIGVIAQRLVRILCSCCVLTETNSEMSLKGIAQNYSATGCNHCTHTGYKGRTGLFELLTISDQLRHHITQNSSSLAMKQCIHSEHIKSLWDDGATKVNNGVTSWQELLRVLS